jgi:ribosome biogenesis GTPase
VGKTTLLNKLVGEERFAVAEVREKSGKGKHVTTARQLIRLPNGSLIIDTPGMRELGVFGVDEGLEDTFDDIHALAQDCRYNDCTHTHEVGCVVREAVEEGRLDSGRYESYRKIRKESEYYSMSYLEKRRREKSFGKMCKMIMKSKKKA